MILLVCIIMASSTELLTVPGGMYLNLYLWLQNTMLTPVLFNGVLKMQVPMIPWEHLIAFTALYCGLYMGGHTVKAILGDQRP
jgi:hypothetical protein